MQSKVEILAPAGSMTVLKAAVNAGADAIYLAGKSFGARAYAKNFDEDELLSALEFAHSYGVRIYLTLNTLVKNEEMDSVYPFLLPFYKAGLDGIIVQDLGIVRYLKEHFPLLPIHASTQMSICSAFGAEGLKKLGITRVVPARELTLNEIRKIKDVVDIEIESFVHGAMCFCYSGRCYFSSFNGGRSGNRGRCAQPCRMHFENGHVLSMKDMCTVEEIPKLLDAGIDSFKIEGRMKNEYYTAMAVTAYKELSEDYYNGCFSYEKADKYKRKLRETFSRGSFSHGYYNGFNGHEMLETVNPGRSGVKVGEVSEIKKGTISFKPVLDIHKKDLLSVYAGKEEISLTSDKDCNKGSLIVLNAPNTKFIKKNAPVYRTRSEELKTFLEKEIIEKPYKRPVNAFLRLKRGEKAELRMKLSDHAIRTENDDIEINVFGDMAENASKSPVTKDSLYSKLKKLGDTPFYLSEFDADIDENVFINISSINEMRREAASMLQNKITSSYERGINETNIVKSENTEANYSEYHYSNIQITDDHISGVHKQCISVLFSKKQQLDAFIKGGYIINRAYIDIKLLTDVIYQNNQRNIEETSRIFSNNMLGEIYAVLPHVYRDKKVYNSYHETVINLVRDNKIKGIFVRNPDDLFWALSDNILKNIKIICASSIYCFNNEAYSFYKELKNDIMCSYSEEQSISELQTLPPLEFKAYGYIEYMVTAQDIMAEKVLNAGDKKYPVVKYADRDYNLLLSEKPVSLHDYTDNFNNIRIEFTVEDYESTLNVLNTFMAKEKASYQFTTGHIERSVI